MTPKFWIVMPATYIWDSEGMPMRMPSRDECRVFYDESDAEDYLLQRQASKPNLDLELVIFEAKTEAVSMNRYGVYKAAPLSA